MQTLTLRQSERMKSFNCLTALLAGINIATLSAEPVKKTMATNEDKTVQIGTNLNNQVGTNNFKVGDNSTVNAGEDQIIQKAEVTGQGNTVNQIINQGISREEMVEMMRQLTTQKGPDYSKEFPLGYAIFGVLRKNAEVVPMKFENGRPLVLEWSKERINVNQDDISLRLPTVEMSAEKVIFRGNLVRFPFEVGTAVRFAFSNQRPAMNGYFIMAQNTFSASKKLNTHIFDSNPTHILTARLEETGEGGFIIILGLKPYTPIRGALRLQINAAADQLQHLRVMHKVEANEVTKAEMGRQIEELHSRLKGWELQMRTAED